MIRIAAAVAAAALFAAPAAAQDIAGPVAAAIDQFGQGVAESMTGGPGLFVTAQGEAPLPAASVAPMTLTIKGTGQTAVEAVADRNAQLDRVRSVANRFDVAMEVGATNYSIGETPSWLTPAIAAPIDWGDLDATAGGDAAAEQGSSDSPTVTASVQVKLDRPNETRMPQFVDALVDAGVSNLSDSLAGLNLGAMGPLMSLLGLDVTRDPGEAVWNQAAADGVRKARAQAGMIAEASGRRLGPVRHVSVLMRSQDGENALVSVAVRFGFED